MRQTLKKTYHANNTNPYVYKFSFSISFENYKNNGRHFVTHYKKREPPIVIKGYYFGGGVF